jgi:BASS family bile acid:Na+ symporter
MLQRILTSFTKLYFPILFASLFIGVSFSQQTIGLATYSTYILATMFFLSALKINLQETVNYFKDRLMLIEVNFFVLIGLPVLVYYFTSFVYPELAIPFLLLAAMPSGMTDALLAEVAGGNKSLALVLTVTTSLLAPFTVPLMLTLLAGTAVSVSFLEIFILLTKVIFVPFALASIVKRFWGAATERKTFWITPISIVLLALLTIGIVAKRADDIRQVFEGGKSLLNLGLLFTFFIGIHIVSYSLARWRNHTDRIAIVVCSTYMNFTLAIYLADKFFTDASAIAPVVLSIIPWSLLLIPFKAVMGRIAYRKTA